MTARRFTSRRSFLARVAGGGAAFGALGLLGASAGAQNTRYSGVTDCDSGNGADRPGYGTGVRNQYTDTDTGPGSDPRCRGRGSNTGANSGTQYGNQYTGCSDSDYGQYGDPGGYGRACRGLPPNQYAPRRSGCTDRDPGGTGDPIGNGRHCTPR